MNINTRFGAGKRSDRAVGVGVVLFGFVGGSVRLMTRPVPADAVILGVFGWVGVLWIASGAVVDPRRRRAAVSALASSVVVVIAVVPWWTGLPGPVVAVMGPAAWGWVLWCGGLAAGVGTIVAVVVVVRRTPAGCPL